MTYSIGMRAPSRAELLGHWCDHLLDQLNDDDRYTDTDLVSMEHPGELDARTLTELRRMVAASLLDQAAFASWFGRFCTERKYPAREQRPARALPARQLAGRLARGAALTRHAGSRYAFSRRDTGLVLFVDGESYPCTGAAAAVGERLCGRDERRLGAGDVASATALALVTTLYNRGSLVFAHAD